MKNFIFNKAFLLGFVCAFVSSVIFNLFTFTIDAENSLRNRVNGYGFPLSFYESGGVQNVSRFLIGGFIGDFLITFFYSILVGLFFVYLWRKNLRDSGSVE